MQTVKQIMCETVNHLPEQATFDDAIYTLYVRQKLERAREDIKAGRTTSQDDMEKKYLGTTR